ncbi:hypothetical protein F4558_003974 [Micromonospora profundi]|nr:hypothetical protein [Micromonospora profundi]
MGSAWQRTKRITSAAFRPVRGRDLSLHAAAITFYGAIAVVPVALLAIWLTSLVAGADRVRRLTSYAVEALPTAIGAPRAVEALVDAGVELTPLLALASLLPASLYGEGLRRAFVSVAAPRTDEHLVGWRGRLLLLPLLAPAPRCCCRSCWRCHSPPAWSGRAAGPARWAWCCRSLRSGWC